MQLHSRFPSAVLLLLVAACLLPQSAYAQGTPEATPAEPNQSVPSFVLTDLIRITEPGTEIIHGSIYSVNDEEVVLGFSSNLPAIWTPFIAVGTDLEFIPVEGFGASVVDINAAGVIVGRTVTNRHAERGTIGYPTVWVDGQPTELPMPESKSGEPAYSGVALAINNEGAIVGEARIDDDRSTRFAVVWTDGRPTVLPNAFDYEACTAFDISENGAIAGQCYDPESGEQRAVAWIGGEVVQLDQGSYGHGWAGSIVDDPITGLPIVSGQVATSSDTPENVSAAIWDLTTPFATLIELDPPANADQCTTWAINLVDGEIWAVGYCTVADDSGESRSAAAIWIDGTAFWLEELVTGTDDYQIEFAFDVNINGTIVGNARKGDEYRGIVLRR